MLIAEAGGAGNGAPKLLRGWRYDRAAALKSAHPRRPGLGPHRREHPRHRAADPSRHHLRARPRQSLSQRQCLRPSRQRDGARRRGGDRGARGRGGDARLRLGHVGGDRALSEPRTGRPCDRARRDVLGAARVARQRSAGLRRQRRFRRDRGFAGARASGEAGRDQARLARDAEQSAVGRERHRRRRAHRPRGRRGAGGRTRRARRRSSPGRLRSAPMS